MALCSVCGFGVVTAFGVGGDALRRGLLLGRTAIKPFAPGDGGAPLPAARVPDGVLPPDGDRTLALVDLALADLLTDADLADVDRHSLGVCLGTTQGAIHTWQRHQHKLARSSHHRPPAPALSGPGRHLARRLDARGPLECPSMACASGTAAVALGAHWIRSGLCRAVVAGGVDAYSAFVHRGFAALKALDPVRARPFDRDRAGLTMGEAAALVLLRAEQDAPPDAPRVSGWGTAADANHLTGPDPEGGGVARAVTAALNMAGLCPDAVDYVSSHGTGTRYNDRMEGQALVKVFGDRAAALPVDAIKGAIGHTMAAAGAVEIVHSLQNIKNSLIPISCGLSQLDPEIPLDLVFGQHREAGLGCALSTSSGFGGFNAAVVLQRSASTGPT